MLSRLILFTQLSRHTTPAKLYFYSLATQRHHSLLTTHRRAILNYNDVIINALPRNLFCKTTDKEEVEANKNESSHSDTETSEVEQETNSLKIEFEKQLADKNTHIEEKDKLIQDLTKKYLLSLAETENTRKQYVKLIEKEKLFAIRSYCKDLIGIADILDIALSSINQDELENSLEPKLRELYNGLQMTEKELQKCFKQHGLVKIDPLGEKFDSHFHESVFILPETEGEPGTVGSVQKVGYTLHSQTLRPSLVGVVKDSF